MLAVALCLLQAAPASAAGKKVLEREIVPGVIYRRVINPKIPRVTHTLTIDPTLVATLDVESARPKLPGMDTTTSMAQTRDAIAAVNGDFGILPGRPAHLFADDGELFQPAIIGGVGRGLGFGPDGTPMHIGATRVRIDLTAPGGRTSVAHWNSGGPGPGELAVFTPRGGTMETPPSDACAARLLPAGGWSHAGKGMGRDFTVDAVRCGQAPMDLGDGFVLAARQNGAGTDAVNALQPGDPVSLRWTLGWDGVTDVIGGSAVLVEDGVNMTNPRCLRYLCLKHPRTGVGITADGKLIIVVVEGRYWRSTGVTPSQFAHIFMHLGATYAMNMDGGGSSTMVVEGKIVNYLSDGVQRQVSSSLLVVADPAP